MVLIWNLILCWLLVEMSLIMYLSLIKPIIVIQVLLMEQWRFLVLLIVCLINSRVLILCIIKWYRWYVSVRCIWLQQRLQQMDRHVLAISIPLEIIVIWQVFVNGMLIIIWRRSGKKEFYGEGQLFFWYNAIKKTEMQSATDQYGTVSVKLSNYVLPIPDAESQYN